MRPQLVVVNGDVQVYLGGTGDGQSGPDAVVIQLSSAVRWQLQLSGGASQTTIQMQHGRLAGIDFTAGSSLITAALPRPAGTVTLTLAAGASQLNLTVPAGVPARLQLYGGAAQAVLGGHVYTGIGGRHGADRLWLAVRGEPVRPRRRLRRLPGHGLQLAPRPRYATQPGTTLSASATAGVRPGTGPDST